MLKMLSGSLNTIAPEMFKILCNKFETLIFKPVSAFWENYNFLSVYILRNKNLKERNDGAGSGPAREGHFIMGFN